MADPIDINSLKKAVRSGALLDPTYNKFISGDSNYANSNSYISDELYKDTFKKAIKENKDIYNQALKESNVTSDEAENPSLISEYWRTITNAAKQTANSIFKTDFEQTVKKSPDEIRSEIVGAYETGKQFDRALKNGRVKTIDGKNTEYLAMSGEISLMEEDDILDKVKYGLGIEKDILGNKKLSISQKNNQLADWFYFLDKDDEGNDILAKTRIENYDKFKKNGTKVLNTYGPTPFNQGFWREFGAGISNTYSGLAANFVNVNRAGSNLLATSLEASNNPFATIARDYATKSTNYGKQFQANYELNQSQPGQGGTSEWLGGGIGQGASSLAQMAILGTMTGGLGRAIAPTASTTSKFQYITNFGAGSILNFNEAYNSALQAGLSENKAASVGALTGAINGLIESVVGTNRLFNYLSGGGDKALARTVLNELGEDISEKGINKVFDSFKKGLTGDASTFINRVFEKQIVGSALEEGTEELLQTFSQKGVENLYDIFLANNKKVGEGKFGTEFFSKETALEALESAFFGAILGAGGDITKIASEKITGKKSYKEDSILPMIADGKRTEVEALVKTMYNGKLISDAQQEMYLSRINHLDNLYQENTGTFNTLDKAEDKDKANLVKAQALDVISNTFDLSKKTEKLSKDLEEVKSNNNISDAEKIQKTQDITKEIRKNQLNIKFFNDYIQEQFTPNENGKVEAYENSYLNQKEILENKFNRFVINDDNKEIDRLISNSTNKITEFESLLSNPNSIPADKTAKEIRDQLNREKLVLSLWNNNKANNDKQLKTLSQEYNNITSVDYQNNLKNKVEEVAKEEVIEEQTPSTTTPIETSPEEFNDNNSLTKEVVETAPVTQEQALTQQKEEIESQLANSENLDVDTINQLSDTLGYIDDTLNELQSTKTTAQSDYNTFLRDNTNLVQAILESENDLNTKNGVLSELKKQIEQPIAGFKSNGIDVSGLQSLHNTISNELINIRTDIKADTDEQDRLFEEAKTAKERNNIPLVSNISFFDRIERLPFMNSNSTYLTDEEYNKLIVNTPIEELLNGIDIDAIPAESLGLVPGSKVGVWNNNTDIVTPKYVLKVYYNGQGLGNINQLDSFTVIDPQKDVNLTEEQLRNTEARNIKLLAALKEGMVTSDLQNIGFNLQWYGEFDMNPEVGRTLIKNFKPAKLVGKSGKQFYYMFDQSSQLEITDLVDDVANELGEIPTKPEGLTDRYLVLVRANNGKLYWVGAQNQVLPSQDKIYTYLFKQVEKLRAITDPAIMKTAVSEINRYLADNVFVANEGRVNTQLQITTPNATNKTYTLALKGTKKRVELDVSKYGTISDLLVELGLNSTSLRKVLPNNANIEQSINSLSSNVTEQIFKNPRLSFKIDDNKLNDFLVGTKPVENTTENGEDIIIESDNPFANYEINDQDPTIVSDEIDIAQFDSSFNTFSKDIKNQITLETQDLLKGYDDLSKLKKKGIETKVRAIISKYKPNTGDPVFSIGQSEEIMDYPQAEQWIKERLPNSISIEDVNRLLGNIKNNGTTFGAFTNNIIYLSNTAAKGTEYHEAFHAVFRTLISDRQIASALALTGQKYGRPGTKQLNDLKASSSVYYNYTDNQLSDLWLEEKMANDFQQYVLNNDNSTSGIKSIWNKIKQWFNFITNNMDEVQALFYNINRGKFKNADIQSNIFSNQANQDAVFQIYKKGVDDAGNIIVTTQKEGQGVLATLTNKYLQGLINNKIKKADYEAKDLLLNNIIAEKAKFYSIDDNPYYEQYLIDKGLEDNDVFINNMGKNLEQKRNIYILPENIAALKKDIQSKAEIFDIDEAVEIEERQDEIDNIGEQFDRDVWTIGGETSFSKVLKEYISLVTIKTQDEYEQEIEEAVDFKKVYRGLIRALSGVEEVDVLPRFKALAEFDEDINAVYNQLLVDLGLTNEGDLNVQNITKNYDLWRKFVTAFNNENVGWYTILHSSEQSRLIESNTNSAKDIQFNDWLQNYSITFAEIEYDENIKTQVDKSVDFINRTENINVSTLKEAKEQAKIVKNAFRKISISLSDAYVAYSLIKKSPYENLDQSAKDMLLAFSGVEGLYDGGNIPYIVSEFKSGYNPFVSSIDDKNKERGAVTRLKDIAAQNALFDPTIGENSFQNADGKNVYSIIRPSFGLVKLRWLSNKDKRQQLLNDDKTKKDDFIDPLENIKLNHILANENIDLIMDNLTPSMIDGYRETTIEGDIDKIDSSEGVTFGKFNAQQYLLADMLMFLSNRKSLNTISDSGKTVKLGESALFNINQMEASNTGYGVFLPVNDYSTINTEVTDILFNYLAQEVIRINKVKNEFDKADTKVWIGYNDKEGARGFKLMEFAGYELDQYVDDITGNKTPEDIYATLLYEKDKIVKAIKNKLELDLADYKEALVANNILNKLPKVELIKRGYLKDGAKIDINVTNKLITDQYLNAYINTLGINNLLLDNYAKKVKGTVDWYKRAKGIIGSGPDMGEGTTKVAVYKEPTKFIDVKSLNNIDYDSLIQIKLDELAANEDLSIEDRANALKTFTKELDKGEIKIADAQSYVTLDHKILQLRRWGRFPAKVEAVYEKIKAGLPITWDEKNILEDNNAALNSTKTVAYNGDYYFKLSELVLTPNLVNIPGFEYLKNKYEAMIRDGVDQALPESASKMATIAPAEFAEDGKFDFKNSIMDLENKFKRLQVETPSGKNQIIHGTQLIQLVHSEQDDNLEIDFKYNTEIKTLGELRDLYRQLLADNRYEAFKTAIAYMRDPISGDFNSKALTKKFYDTIVKSGADEVLSNFFTPNHNGERQFNWNLGPIVNKAEQLFLAHFSKGVLSQKVPGLKVSLVSDTGIKIKDAKTGKMRSLQHMVKDEDGNYYSECLLPPFANELLGKNPSDSDIKNVLKMFGIRIPTQDKHSMIALKVVGFLPVEYGSVGIFPKEIVFLSGADFDIDSEFIHRPDFYTVKGGRTILYGSAKTDEGKFKEYIKWNLSNNKLLASKLKDIKSNDDISMEEAEALFTDGRNADIKTAMKALNMPSTLEEFIERRPINIGANNNAMLEAQIKFLTNSYVRERAAMIPASMDSIKDVAKIVSRELGLDNQTDISPNTPLARFRANRSNMEGKNGIGPVALANTTHALLSTYNQKLFKGLDLPVISDKVANGFEGIYTINSETNRKNDNISTLLSAMTDNAKEQLAKLLNLTFDPKNSTYNTLPVASYMLSVGYTMEETVLLLNQPNIRAYITNDNDLLTKLDDLRVKVESKAIEDVVSIKPLTIEYLTNKLNISELTIEDYTTQQNILELFINIQAQASYVQSISSLMSLNKGLDSTFDDNLSLENTLKKLQLGFINNYITDDIETSSQLLNKLVEQKVLRKEGSRYYKDINMPVFKIGRNVNKTPFDAREVILNDPNTLQNIIIYKKVMDTSKEFFLMNTPVFKKLRGITRVSSKDLVPFFMDKANRTYLEEVFPDKYESFMRASENAAYMVDKSGEQAIGRELYKLKKDPDFRNNLLIKMLTLKNASRDSKIVQIEFPTRIKAEGDFYTNLNNAFKELFMNVQTREFARKLYYYSYFKDGLQFKNKSFINTIPSWVFRDVSSSLDILNDDFKDQNFEGYSSIKEGLVPTVKDMLNSLIKVSKFNSSLPRLIKNNRAIIKNVPAIKGVNAITLLESFNFNNQDAYIKSIKDYLKENPSDNYADLLENDYSLRYNLASYYEGINEATAETYSKGVMLNYLKGFDMTGAPVTYNLDQTIDFYMRNGVLPVAYEFGVETIDPIIENGFNTSINGMNFLTSFINTDSNNKDIKEPKLVIESFEEIDPNFEDVQFIEEPIQTNTENLDNSENNSTFVNPFAGAIDDDISAEDVAFMMQYQNTIDNSILEDDIINELDANVEKFEDENGDPIC